MGKKLEQKILEEIRRQVVAKDDFLREKEELEKETSATLEALAEITSLGRNEVEKIAARVRRNMIKGSRRKKILLALCGLVVLIPVIWAVNFFWLTPPPFRLVENFDGPERGWEVGPRYHYNRTMKGGEYLYENARSGWCTWDAHAFYFPGSYSIQLTSVWKQGKYDQYGLMLLENSDHYVAFRLKGDGKTNYEVWKDGKSEFISPLSSGQGIQGDGRVENVQRVDVTNGRFKYFVNDQMAAEGPMTGIKPKHFAVAVCGRQTVAFKHVEIKTLPGITENITEHFDGPDLKRTGVQVYESQSVAFDELAVIPREQTARVLLDEPFDRPSGDWLPRMDLVNERHFDGGRYLFTCRRDDWCYWSTIPLTVQPPFEVTLSNAWIKGESGSYGFMLMTDDDNYLLVELENTGRARLGEVVNKQWIYTGEWETMPGVGGAEMKIQRLVVGKRKIEYYLNDRLVEEYKIKTLNDRKLNYIGLRVCDGQTVAFDSLIITSR